MSKQTEPSSQYDGMTATAFVKGEEKKGEPTLLYAISSFIEALFKDCPKRLRRRTLEEDHPFLIIAHRGSPSREVENTIPSFQLGLQEGANAIELDLCITKDGQVVVWHDWEPDDIVTRVRQEGLEPIVSYTTYSPEEEERRRPVCDLTLEELRSWYGYCHKSSFERVESHIPTFDEFIDWFIGHEDFVRAVFLDVKLPEDRIDLLPPLMDSIRASLERCNSNTEFIFESMSKEIVRRMKACYPSGNYCLDVEMPPGLVLFPSRESATKKAVQMGNSYALAMRPRSITVAPWVTYRRLVTHDTRHRQKHNRLHPHRELRGMIAATVNDPEEMRCLITLGINGIQTDLPNLLRKVYDEVRTELRENV
ncbi:MAG: glycerophosphodiester phosphodiesterase [Candidatus Kapaibacterium sp.]